MPNFASSLLPQIEYRRQEWRKFLIGIKRDYHCSGSKMSSSASPGLHAHGAPQALAGAAQAHVNGPDDGVMADLSDQMYCLSLADNGNNAPLGHAGGHGVALAPVNVQGQDGFNGDDIRNLTAEMPRLTLEEDEMSVLEQMMSALQTSEAYLDFIIIIIAL